MKILAQPYGEKLGQLLAADLESGKYHSFIFSVAYAKISGVDALYDAILKFRLSGGRVHATVGIDQKNTSYEAVRAILGFAEELFIFHNRSMASTFHPKAYVLIGETQGKIYVGSNNLTNGGLYSNYEVVSYDAFDLTNLEEAESFAHMIRLLGEFRKTGPCCKKATDEFIQKLYEKHMLCSESEIYVTSRKGGSAKAGISEDDVFGVEPITGRARKHSFEHLAPEVKVRPEYQEGDANGTSAEAEPAVEDAESPAKSFYKKLSRNDVDLKSSPGQIIIPIAFKPFFEPLSEPQRTKAGAMQSERYFNLKYENSGEIVENARVIFYVPSPQAPRKNSEVRFAMRNRDVFVTFEQGDILVFTQVPRGKNGEYAYTVKRVPHGSAEANAYTERFAWIVE